MHRSGPLSSLGAPAMAVITAISFYLLADGVAVNEAGTSYAANLAVKEGVHKRMVAGKVIGDDVKAFS